MPFYEPEPIPCEAIDPALNMFVPVIASYNAEGECRPLYFRYISQDGAYHDISVSRVLTKKQNSVFGTIYQCEYMDHGYRKEVALYFHRRENKWSLRLC